MTLFLAGFMGCGKTTVGEIIAEKLGTELIDTDAYIVEKEGRSIPQIFDQEGENYFREKEATAIMTLADKGGVVALGGGTLMNINSATIAQKSGTVVLIDVPFDVCYERIREDENRPLVQQNSQDELEAIYDKRMPIYRKVAKIIVQGDKNPEEVAEDILKQCQVNNI